MNGTTITTTVSGDCFVETHRNTCVRHFNGRKYTTTTHLDFFQYITDTEVHVTGDAFAVYFRYVSTNRSAHKVGHVYKIIGDVRPTNLMRAMADLIPDDSQAVPF